MKHILFYADDPGGANFIAPLIPIINGYKNFTVDFYVSNSILSFCSHRNYRAQEIYTLDVSRVLENIDLLVVGTSENRDCLAHKLVDCARKKKIPSVGLVDMAVNAENRFRGYSDNALEHAPDFLVVNDEGCSLRYKSIGYPADKIHAYGHPHFDSLAAKYGLILQEDIHGLKRKCFPGAPTNRPVWLFLAEGVDRLAPHESYFSEDYKLKGARQSTFRGAIVLEELLLCAGKFDPMPWVVLRPHPKTEMNDFIHLYGELGSISTHDDPINEVWAADLVIGMTTMLLMEAALIGCCNISIVPRDVEREWLESIKLGLTPCATSRDEIFNLIKDIKPASRKLSNLVNYGATIRISKFICDILN